MIESGKYDLISLEDIVSSAKMQLNIDGGDDDIFLEKLANEGVRHLNSLSIFVKKEKCLSIQSGKAKLPKGFNQFIALYFSDENGNPTSELVYLDKPYVSDLGVNSEVFLDFKNTFQIIDGYIHFTSLIGNGNCVLVYSGLNVDVDGLMKVYSHYERGLTAYVCWMYCLNNFRDYPFAIIAEYKRQWIKQKAWIKGKDVKDEADYTRWQLQKIFNAFLINKNFKG